MKNKLQSLMLAAALAAFAVAPVMADQDLAHYTADLGHTLGRDTRAAAHHTERAAKAGVHDLVAGIRRLG